MKIQQDKYTSKALALIKEGTNLFITGKAGTGKTTLLREVVAESEKRKKNVAILSPTGVAAMNAGGVTIHSFLKLPTSIYIPGMKIPGLYSLKPEDIQIIKKIDLIIIDEVSMVRCDLLDAMDDVLRHYIGNENPFGGKQMVFFGDLYQLMPVAEEEDWKELSKHYESSYFFSSKVYQKLKCPMLELQKVHRQDNIDFVELLNSIRRGYISKMELQMLDSRYNKNYIGDDDTIRLTTHNYKAWKYNQEKLDAIEYNEVEYKAWIDGFYPKDDFPTDYVLRLKKGARVMFVRNDNVSRKYINGSLGTVTHCSEGLISVKLDNGTDVFVERCIWEKLRYKVNKQTKMIETSVLGTFKQYPLKLAWAVTIHKCQGLTFDKVVIDAGRSFTYGQVYVALSRCRTFDGITLVSPISEKVISTDPVVNQFMHQVNRIVFEEEKKTEYSGPREETLKLTRLLANDGCSVEQIAKIRKERSEIVYGHLYTLVERGEVDARKYVPEPMYSLVWAAILKYGIHESLVKLRKNSDPNANFGQIRLVIADYIRQSMEHPENFTGYSQPTHITEEKEKKKDKQVPKEAPNKKILEQEDKKEKQAFKDTDNKDLVVEKLPELIESLTGLYKINSRKSSFVLSFLILFKLEEMGVHYGAIPDNTKLHRIAESIKKDFSISVNLKSIRSEMLEVLSACRLLASEHLKPNFKMIIEEPIGRQIIAQLMLYLSGHHAYSSKRLCHCNDISASSIPNKTQQLLDNKGYGLNIRRLSENIQPRDLVRLTKDIDLEDLRNTNFLNRILTYKFNPIPKTIISLMEKNYYVKNFLKKENIQPRFGTSLCLAQPIAGSPEETTKLNYYIYVDNDKKYHVNQCRFCLRDFWISFMQRTEMDKKRRLSW